MNLRYPPGFEKLRSGLGVNFLTRLAGARFDTLADLQIAVLTKRLDITDVVRATGCDWNNVVSREPYLWFFTSAADTGIAVLLFQC